MKRVKFIFLAVTQSESERACISLIRLQKSDGSWIWCHCVIQIKESNDPSQSPVIICTNQILRWVSHGISCLGSRISSCAFFLDSTEEASVMQANSWLYHYYMVQSRLQYNLAYGGQPSSIAALYPQMLHLTNNVSSHHHAGQEFDGYTFPASIDHEQYLMAAANMENKYPHPPPPPPPPAFHTLEVAAVAQEKHRDFWRRDPRYYELLRHQVDSTTSSSSSPGRRLEGGHAYAQSRSPSTSPSGLTQHSENAQTTNNDSNNNNAEDGKQ